MESRKGPEGIPDWGPERAQMELKRGPVGIQMGSEREFKRGPVGGPDRGVHVLHRPQEIGRVRYMETANCMSKHFAN